MSVWTSPHPSCHSVLFTCPPSSLSSKEHYCDVVNWRGFPVTEKCKGSQGTTQVPKTQKRRQLPRTRSVFEQILRTELRHLEGAESPLTTICHIPPKGSLTMNLDRLLPPSFNSCIYLSINGPCSVCLVILLWESLGTSTFCGEPWGPNALLVTAVWCVDVSQCPCGIHSLCFASDGNGTPPASSGTKNAHGCCCTQRPLRGTLPCRDFREK